MDDYKEMQARLINWVIVIAISGLLVFFIIRLVQERRFAANYQTEYSALTKGVIQFVGEKKGPRAGKVRFCVIRYSDTRYNTYSLQVGAGNAVLQLGDSVTVRYKPTDPGQAILEGSVKSTSSDVWIPLIAVFGVFLILFVLVRNDRF